MKPRRLKPAFKDSRGVITDILEGVPINSITMITSKKGVVRGNHVHRRTIQYTYLLEGRLRYVSRKGKNGRLRRHVMRPGDLTWSPPAEAHTVVALENSRFLVFSRGPRAGRDYETDTFRLKDPLVAPKR